MTNIDTVPAVNEILYRMRVTANLTQDELGQRLGWTPASTSNVASYETGKRKPSSEMIGRWANACGFIYEGVIKNSDGKVVWTVELI